MKIDKQMHEHTKYRLPRLREQFQEARKEVASYVLLGKGWNGYEAKGFRSETIFRAVAVLDQVEKFFEENIGFLNNRSFDIDTTPSNDDGVHIDFDYNHEYTCDIYVNERVEIIFYVTERHVHEGKYTIADRDVDLYWPKDKMQRKCPVSQIRKFLHEAFYVHKWSDQEREQI